MKQRPSTPFREIDRTPHITCFHVCIPLLLVCGSAALFTQFNQQPRTPTSHVLNNSSHAITLTQGDNTKITISKGYAYAVPHGVYNVQKKNGEIENRGVKITDKTTCFDTRGKDGEPYIGCFKQE